MYKLIFLLLFLPSISYSQSFDNLFENKTLRLDYIVGGNAKAQYIMLDEMSVNDNWYGKKINLNKIPQRGNGQITIYNQKTNKVIYKNAFSSLFTEWLDTDNSKNETRSFENTKIVPYPKEKSIIETIILNQVGDTLCSIKTIFDPKDILIRKNKMSEAKYEYIKKSNKKNCINIAILSEGYKAGEMDKFINSAKIFRDELLKKEPFKKYKYYLNIIAVKVNSKDSGISIPHKNLWFDTPFNSHFDSFYSDRYLTTQSQKNIYNSLTGIPFSHIVILANTENYGGGGIYNDINLISANNPKFIDIAIHEFGHSFAGLADEYYYETDMVKLTSRKDIEPWEQNITNLANFKNKWEKLIKKNTPIPTLEKDTTKYPIGLYEGAILGPKGVYRASYTCLMKTLATKEFCPACQKGIEEIIKYNIKNYK